MVLFDEDPPPPRTFSSPRSRANHRKGAPRVQTVGRDSYNTPLAALLLPPSLPAVRPWSATLHSNEFPPGMSPRRYVTSSMRGLTPPCVAGVSPRPKSSVATVRVLEPPIPAATAGPAPSNQGASPASGSEESLALSSRAAAACGDDSKEPPVQEDPAKRPPSREDQAKNGATLQSLSHSGRARLAAQTRSVSARTHRVSGESVRLPERPTTALLGVAVNGGHPAMRSRAAERRLTTQHEVSDRRLARTPRSEIYRYIDIYVHTYVDI